MPLFPIHWRLLLEIICCILLSLFLPAVGQPALYTRKIWSRSQHEFLGRTDFAGTIPERTGQWQSEARWVSMRPWQSLQAFLSIYTQLLPQYCTRSSFRRRELIFSEMNKSTFKSLALVMSSFWQKKHVREWDWCNLQVIQYIFMISLRVPSWVWIAFCPFQKHSLLNSLP